ncbi:Tetratricopeptide repeat protein [Candidatus Koribacter versatilis Ellin345]|uniref:Tetratricopeptide repeat protein n=1 Tax=Koribacter versatilis (strain Ellin345) TaxID=204669 RepID=Q1IIQ5_KORVE|nr:hypothetical protein [Candidatus Koribacter versatilis]ABF43245.1 Tetratricopeptide repeat protein [Candidatus Koribacter versatilis Ellin345]
MTELRRNHPGPDELAASVFGFVDESTREHVDSCPQCSEELSLVRETRARLQRAAGPEDVHPTPMCPDEERWSFLAAGRLSASEEKQLHEHASDCLHCGRLLKLADDDLAVELSQEERATIASLASSRPAQQRALGERMSELMEAGAARERRPSPPARARWLRWALPAATAALAGCGALYWSLEVRPLRHADNLIAAAYTSQRPFDLRLPGAAYGPIRQQRGGATRRLDQPDLLQAEAELAIQLDKHKTDPDWLRAQARIALLEGDPSQAVALLEPLSQHEGVKPGTMMDLAIAYIALGDVSTSPRRESDYKKGLSLLDRSLTADPASAVALFNRALVLERLQRQPEAAAAWKEYLKVDAESAWAHEARAHVG